MEELQQLKLATKLLGLKIWVIVLLFSVPKIMYSLWYDDHFWEAKGQWECPCGEGPFQVRDASLSCSPKGSSLGRRHPKGLKSLKAAEQFLTAWHLPRAAAAAEMFLASRGKSRCYCCRSLSQSLECSCLCYTRTWFPPQCTEQLRFPPLVVWDLFFSSECQELATRVGLGIYLVPTLQKPWR